MCIHIILISLWKSLQVHTETFILPLLGLLHLLIKDKFKTWEFLLVVDALPADTDLQIKFDLYRFL